MKKVLVIVLAIAMMAALAACGGKDSGNGGAPGSGNAPAADTTLAGSYTAKIDMTDIMAEQDSNYTFSTPFMVTMQMNLYDDDTFDIGMNLDEFLAEVETFYRAEMPALVNQMFEEQNVTDEMLEQQLKALGVDSLDEFIEQQIQENLNLLKQQYYEESGYHAYVQGYYKVEGDKISFTAEEDQEAELKDNCKINEDGSITLTIDLGGQDYDLVFKK